MDINLYPVRREESLIAIKRGQALTVNGERFDFSRMADGDSLPASALASKWITGSVDNVAGNLSLTLILPLPANFSPEQAFPKPLLSLEDGELNFPKSLDDASNGLIQAEIPTVELEQEGRIDWSQLVTASMKAELSAAASLSLAKVELATKNSIAATQIARIHDRVQTLGYGIDAGEATEEDEAEQSSLMINLRMWKGYKFALGKISSLPTWPTDPSWPTEPLIPDIEAAPMAKSQGDL